MAPYSLPLDCLSSICMKTSFIARCIYHMLPTYLPRWVMPSDCGRYCAQRIADLCPEWLAVFWPQRSAWWMPCYFSIKALMWWILQRQKRETAESMWNTSLFFFFLLFHLSFLLSGRSSTTKMFQHLGWVCVGGAGDQIALSSVHLAAYSIKVPPTFK